MGSYEKTFDWVQFEEGRAKFNGGIRGGDEHGHETYAVEIRGEARYGEISKTYLSNDNDYNVEVVSFGFGVEENVGHPDQGARGFYTQAQLNIVQSLVSQLIGAGLDYEDRPSILRESPKSHFKGKILFREGWANVRPEILP